MPNWTVESYHDKRGQPPIDEYLRSLQAKDRARVSRAILLLEDYGPALRMPHARHLEGKVWELRIDGRPTVTVCCMQACRVASLCSYTSSPRKRTRRQSKTSKPHDAV